MTAVAQQGAYAYIGVGPRLVILDVTDPTRPVEVGKTAPISELAKCVAVASGYAYVGDGGGLQLMDVSDRADPAKVGFYDAPASVSDVAVLGSLAYVAATTSGLRVVNILNPRQPSEVGFYDTPGLPTVLRCRENTPTSPMGCASMTQPGKVGSVTMTRTSSGSPSSAQVCGMKP